MVVKCKNGVKIKFEQDAHYYTVTVGRDTWYWRKANGEFDGHSKRIN